MAIFAFTSVALVSACSPNRNVRQTRAASDSTGATRLLRAIDRARLDTTCAPCANFWQYANGGWAATTPIPPDRSSWGAGPETGLRTREVIRTALDAASEHAAAIPVSTIDKAGVYWATCLDSTAAEAAGAAPIEGELTRIAVITNLRDLRKEIASLQLDGVPAIFNSYASLDPMRSSRMVLWLSQGGLGLPDREYYLHADPTSRSIRATYAAAIATTLRLLGDRDSDANHAADRILRLETALARASMSLADQQDPAKLYHPESLRQFEALAPIVGLRSMLDSWRVDSLVRLNVSQPAFFRAVDDLLRTAPISDWRAYLRWHLASTASPWLGSAFANADFTLRRRLGGVVAPQPRWERCLGSLANGPLQEAAGEVYVARAFTPAAKARALAMVENLESVLRGRLDSVGWMRPATRRRAIAKLDSYINKIGYPDRWRSYAELDVKRGPFITNFLSANRSDGLRSLAEIGKPVDRSVWRVGPAEVDAFYNDGTNELVFPAGILQPPFFDPEADDAVNYGEIGSLIGHEMTHGFDNGGRQIDEHGNLREWWTPADAGEYARRARLVKTQYDGYIGVDTMHVNGKQTLSENIADLGGVRIAYAAYRLSLTGKPEPPIMDGFTGDQRFFLAYANRERGVRRPQSMRTFLLSDTHSPKIWRVNGPLSNMPEFARAFGCKAGDPMVRPDSVRVEIW